ncbi:MAG: hypothetical protein C4295_07095 [Candidatus Fervidibacterota bacterium]
MTEGCECVNLEACLWRKVLKIPLGKGGGTVSGRNLRWFCGLVGALFVSVVVASSPSSSSLPSHPLVATARKYLGTRYRYGGASPSRGFDCSGLVYYLLSRHGIRAPHSAAELFRMGKPIARSALRPGDLVFFRNTAHRRGITHVGIYIGNGKFIHASSGRGRVTVSRLSDPYYAARYAGARRLPLR